MRLDRPLGTNPDYQPPCYVHDRMDYRIGKTRVLCNSWGYPDEGNE
ncbi:MAG: hypothetical protein M0003_05970 [Acidithiobacillus sp.]|nr:hypothetical protein [Acidithiobacillus sp.]